ncbi:MAG: 5-formyltetrahydrofolate cyclo-ligase [Phycisphaerales bacterium]|nr:MAG: 5-formyltetrahydrofolate cyclo-ligase [Phycisphaerales bacterium]
MSEREEKARLRAEMKRVLAGIDEPSAAARSRELCDRLLGSDLLGGGPVMVFAPIPGEVDLGPLAEALVASGRAVCLPRIDWKTKSMAPALVTSIDRERGGLVVRRHDVPEPSTSAPIVEVGSLSCVLVPGLAFDREGGRLGRGAGFYDRFVQRCREGATGPGGTHGPIAVGVCFDEQLIDRVPTEGHDLMLDAVATPTKIRRRSGGLSPQPPKGDTED